MIARVTYVAIGMEETVKIKEYVVINYRSLLNFDQLVHFEKIVEKCIYNNLINIVVDCIAVDDIMYAWGECTCGGERDHNGRRASCRK